MDKKIEKNIKKALPQEKIFLAKYLNYWLSIPGFATLDGKDLKDFMGLENSSSFWENNASKIKINYNIISSNSTSSEIELFLEHFNVFSKDVKKQIKHYFFVIQQISSSILDLIPSELSSLSDKDKNVASPHA